MTWLGIALKIAIVGTTASSGGNVRIHAYKRFLESKNHNVDLINVTDGLFSKASFSYYRLKSQMNGQKTILMKEIARRAENKIRKRKYEAIIGVESLFSYVLTKKFDCLKLFSWEAMGADECYFANSKFSNMDCVKAFREMEVEICRHSDYVIFPWATTENYVRNNIFDADNFLTVKFGCYPKTKPVSHFFPCSIVSFGGLGGYWANAQLIADLKNKSPYHIDVYGFSKPPRKYRLNYKGFAPSLDVLYNYQFGLNTVSKDPFRRKHFSSRILTYLAYGLPVLSPDWMQLSHELKGCLPYNENNFVDLVDKYSEKNSWEKLSQEAHKQALGLDWNTTLKPLEKIISL